MSDEGGATTDWGLDGAGVAMLVLLTLIIAPVMFLTTIWVLTAGLDFASTPAFNLAWVALTAGLVALVARAGIGELRGGVGVQIDERGVARGAVALAWSEVERLEAPAFGLLDISGAGKTLRLRTYLFRNRKELLEFIGRQTGKPVPELLHG